MAADATNDNLERAEPTAPGGTSPASPESVAARATGVGRGALVIAPWQALLLSLLAGLVVWAILESILPVFELSEELAALQGPAMAPRLAEIQQEREIANTRNTMLSLVVLAFTLALLLTAAEALLRRDLPRAVWGGLLAGIVAGAIALGAGAAGAALAKSLKLQANPQEQTTLSPLAKSVLVQGGMLGVLGLGVGLALSLPLFRPDLCATCVLGCLLGGLVAALVFPLTASTLLPNVGTEKLMPDAGVARLLWIGLATTLIGATVAGLGKERPKREPAQSAASAG